MVPRKGTTQVLGESVRTVSQRKGNSLEFVACDFARRLRRDFSEEIARNPRDFKKQVVRLIRRELPPKRGRPTDPRLDAAAQMVQQGQSPKDVLRTQIPGFESLDTYGRYLAEKGLRAALARRKEGSAGIHLTNESHN